MSGKISDAEALMSLVKDGTAPRSKIGRLRSVFREIEQLQISGLSNQAIVGKLNELGYDLTLKTFETMLYRIRKEAGTAKSVLKKAVPGGEKQTSVSPALPAINEPKGTENETEKDDSMTIQEKLKNMPEIGAAKFEAYSKSTNPLKKQKS